MNRLLLLALVLLVGTGCNTAAEDDSFRASGTIEATEVRIASRLAGQIRVLNVEEGRAVRPGDTLAVIDHDLLMLQLQQSQAGQEAASARVDLLREGARREDIAQAAAALRQAQVQEEAARQDAERARALFASGSVTRKFLDDAETRLRVTSEAVTAARQNVAKLQTLTRPSELRAAEAAARQSGAQTNLLRRQIQDAFIIAPTGGVITEKLVEEGELVSAGTGITTISELNRVFLRVYVPETALGAIRLGQTLEVETDGGNRALKGKITWISPRAEFTPKNVQTREERAKLVYQVKIEVPNTSGILKPGMYADAVIPIGSEK